MPKDNTIQIIKIRLSNSLPVLKKVFLLILLFSAGNTLLLNAQFDNWPTGTRAAAMANAYVSESDIWSVSHNQAGLGFFPHFAIGFHHENKFLVDQYSLHALALSLPVKSGTFGLSYSYFGYNAFNVSKLGLAFGKKFGDNFAAGVQMNYHNNFIEGDYENRNALSIEGGIQYRPAENIAIGVHVFNPSRTKISAYENDTIPSYINLGMHLQLFSDFQFSLQAKKQFDRNIRLIGGAEYIFMDNLFLRAGIISNPIQGTFGLGYKLGKLSADIAFSHHSILGFTPHFSFQAIIR